MQLQNFSANDFGRARNPAGELAMPRRKRINRAFCLPFAS
jgi:hypothetical protein